MRSANETRRLRRLMQGMILLVAVSFLAIGWKGYSTAASAGPKGQFGVDGAETLKYLRGLDFTIASTGDSIVVKQYPCAVNPTQCPTAGVRLMLIPESSAEQRDWESAMEPNRSGHVVAVVVNVDGMTFPDLGLKSGERAYAWVGQIGPNATDRGFAIYRLDANGVATNTWFMTKDVSRCENSEVRSKPAIKTAHPAGGSPCVRIGLASPSLGMFASHTATPASAGALLAGQLWISCSGGCCEVKTL